MKSLSRENSRTARFRTSVFLPDDKTRTLDMILLTPLLHESDVFLLVQENGRLSGYCTIAVAVATLYELI